MSQECVNRFRFGNWEVDIANGELFKSGRKVRIQRQPFKVLEALLVRAGEVVTREELRQELWPGTHVEVDLSLNTALKKLRAILGDNSRLPVFIETIPQRGYRFLQKSHILTPESAEDALRREQSEPSDPPLNIRLAVLPFENLDADGKDYLGDGVTGHILALCTGLDSSITMVAMPSVVRYKHTSKSTLQLCRELKANYILTGSTLCSGDMVRVDVNLIKSDQSCVWSHSYTYSALDLLRGQEQICEHIVRSILQVLSPVVGPMHGSAPGSIELSQHSTIFDPSLTSHSCDFDNASCNRGWLSDGSVGQASSGAPCVAERAANVAFIVDSDIHILDLSCAAAQFLGEENVAAVLGRRAGEVFQCLHSSLVPEGCGRSPNCGQCVIRNSATSCLEGHTVNRARTKIDFLPEARQKSRDLLITASRMSNSEEGRALLIMEDVTEAAGTEPRLLDS